MLRPGQTIATSQRNTSQHCWPNICKLRPNDRNIPTQHIATLLSATCCMRLATALRCIATCWVLLAQIGRTLGSLKENPDGDSSQNVATKGLMSRTMAMHVRYNSWYISLPSSAKQLHEMTKFCIFWRKWTTTANYLNFYFKFIAVFHIHFRDSLDNE